MPSSLEFKFNSNVHIEADFALPSDAGNFKQLVEHWFSGAVNKLADPNMNPFTSHLDLTGHEDSLKKSGQPYGHPGELWGSLWVTRNLKSGQKLTGTVWTPRNWQKFLKVTEAFPLKMIAQISTLGHDGFPGDAWINISMIRDYHAPDWVAMMVDQSSSVFSTEASSLEMQAKAKEFLIRHLDSGHVCLFGCIADDVDTTTRRTSLECALGVFPDQTIPQLDHSLRGYSWITACSPGVSSRLGGKHAMRSNGAFEEVIPLPSGGLLLQATRDMRNYQEEKIRAVFDALKPVLPAGEPLPYFSDMTQRIVFQDAADA